VLVFLCMYEIHIYAAVYMRCYNVGCLKMFVPEKLDVLVSDVINLQCCFFLFCNASENGMNFENELNFKNRLNFKKWTKFSKWAKI
jgi:hypothetical protein